MEPGRCHGGRGASPPGGAGAGTGRPSHHLGRPRPPQRAAVAAALVEPARAAGQGRAVPLQRAGVLESVVASFKAALVPVNTNYRYQDAELLYLWDNADVVAVVFHGTFTERIEGLRPRLPKIHTWLWVDDGSGPCPSGRSPTRRSRVGRAPRRVRTLAPGRRRSPPALHRRHHRHPQGRDVAPGRSAPIYNRARLPAPYDLAAAVDGIREQKATEGPGRVVLPASPLMHGTGLLTGAHDAGLGRQRRHAASRRFDAAEMLDAVHRHRVEGTAIVGDAFARPLARRSTATPDAGTSRRCSASRRPA